MSGRATWRTVSAVGAAAAVVAYARWVRPWHLRWGATDDEVAMPLPGDDLMDHAGADHAVTVHAPAETVWPWLVQIGQDRAGFYSYTWLENAVLAGIHNADRVHPEWQDLKAGDYVRLAQKRVYGDGPRCRVALVEPGRALVLERWGAFVLHPVDERTCRLHVRSHAQAGGSLPYVVGNVLLFEPAHFVMERKMLLEIKARAEAARVGLEIERFLPAWDVTLVERRRVDAPPARTYDAVLRADLMDPWVRALFAVREAPERFRRWMGGHAQAPLKAVSLADIVGPETGFAVLADVPGRELVIGSVGRFWAPDYGHVEVAAEDFAAFDRPGFAKLAMSLRVDPDGSDCSVLRYEARTATTDATARRLFRRYWRVIRPGVALVMQRALRRIQASAEGRRAGELSPPFPHDPPPER